MDQSMEIPLVLLKYSKMVSLMTYSISLVPEDVILLGYPVGASFGDSIGYFEVFKYGNLVSKLVGNSLGG